ALVILREWGQSLADRKDLAGANAHWSELLELTLAGKDESKSPASRQPVSGTARDEARPEGGGEAAPAAQTDRDGRQAPLVPPASLEQFNKAAEMARLAAEAGLRDLSLQAIGRSLAGGPPINDSHASHGRFGTYGRMGRVSRGAFGTAGALESQDQQVLQTVSSTLARMIAAWERAQVPLQDQYEVVV